MKKIINPFSIIRNERTKRIFCFFVILNILVEIISPTAALALTSGPISPEFSSFEPVATTDMVNDFSGDFTYNIPVLNVPGPDGGNYSMSLSYHSGSSSEEEASWVGYGWTLNAGAINRSKRGYADDFKNVSYESYNKTKPNVNQSANFNVNIEISSKDGDTNSTKIAKELIDPGVKLVKKKFFLEKTEIPENDYTEVVSVSFTKSIRFNNYSGFSISNSIGASRSEASLQMNSSAGNHTLGYSINPIATFNSVKKLSAKKLTDQERRILKIQQRAEQAVQNQTKTREQRNSEKIEGNFRAAKYSINSYNVPGLSYSIAREASSTYNYNGSVVVNPANVPIGGQLGFQGSMSIRANLPKDDKKIFGYLYSESSNNYLNNPAAVLTLNDPDNLFDYQIEKESTFDKHDKIIGIPFNNADIFSATGNNVVGGFRIQHSKIGTFYPNTKLTAGLISQLGFEIGIGANFQIGINVGVGTNITRVAGIWNLAHHQLNNNNSNNFYKAQFSAPNQAFMRFTNDMGGEVNYNPSSTYDDIPHATIDLVGLPMTKTQDYELDLTDITSKSLSGNSSNINYSKTGDIITGINITNKDGSKANYGLPVFTANEAELAVGLTFNNDGKYIVTSTLDYNNPLKNPTVVGSKVADEYANSFLLTSNTTFNYVDINNNGVDDADFGGWTKFAYHKAWGTNNDNGNSDWYRFRTPYNGLLYNANRLVNKTDQTGSMSSGEKEVYFLKNVETKTHVAFFITNKTLMATDFPQSAYPFLYDANTNLPLATITSILNGSGVDRLDGLDAAGIDGNGMDIAALSTTATGTHKLEKLERIVLFAKNDLSKPLTTTFFEYDYTVATGIPNTIGTTTNQKGKLTLKKVWTESNGVNRSQISPYIFNYEYFNQYPTELVNKYSWLQSYNILPNNDAKQNPQYKPWQLDAWGNNQPNGDVRFMNMQHGVSQTADGRYPSPTLNNSDNFDPAAWQLKRIQLPSGGEIHIHYEQKDYLSVQDKLPMAMVSLLYDANNVKNGYKSDEAIYKVNLADLGIPNDGNVAKYLQILKTFFLTERNKLYYKMFYSYSGDDQPQVNSSNQRYDYVTGYTTVNDITILGNEIYFHLGDLRESIFTDDKGKKDKTLPRWACYQQMASNGGNNMGINANDYKDDDYTDQIYGTNGNPIGPLVLNAKVIAHTFAKTKIKTLSMFNDWVLGRIKNPNKSTTCTSLNYSMSYLKLPTYYAKKGGGIRVKRILTFDKGIQTGDAMLFGSEYNYVDKEGRSSGVAVNEPSSIREENALVAYRERFKQKVIDKVLSGRDTKADEYPVGENLLPSATVVHSRIVTNNIHSGKSTTGFAVNEYFTSKDFPMEVDYTAIKKKPGGGGTFKKFSLNLPTNVINLSINRASVTQGFLFKLNDMNGKIKSKATYAGNYVKGFDQSLYTSKTTYNYSQPGEPIKTLVMDQNGDFVKQELRAGNEQDYCIFSSNVSELSLDFNFEIDLNVALGTPPVGVNLGPTSAPKISFTNNVLKQHATSRVINQTSFLLSTTNITDGVAQTTENIAFDRYTGEPVFTRTFDGYVSNDKNIYTQNSGSTKHQGYYYSLNIPASWAYTNMKPIISGNYTNTANTNQLTANMGNIVTYSTNTLYDYVAGLSYNPWSPIANPFVNVVSASATTFTNNWFTAGSLTEFVAPTNTALITAPVVNKSNSFYYPLRTYSYRDNVANANAANGRIYKAGVITNTFNFFDWLNPNSPVPNEWYSDSKITKYSPFGYPVEEEDVLNIKSAARFGYNNTLPVSVAQNAAYDEVFFTDFEFGATSLFTNDAAHTGNRSFELSLPTNQNYAFVPSYKLTADIITKRGLGVKFWLKSIASQNLANVNYGLKNPNPQVKVIIGTVAFNTKAIAQTGDWTLYSADIKSFQGLQAATSYPIMIGYNYSTSTEQVFVDDFRVQPLDASMNCSVYYADNKLAAQFDDQHFAVMYEYNNKGMLTRKSIETERGKKTLQEQQYNTPLINK